MLSAVPPFISAVKFVISRRWDLFRFLRHLPRLCLAELRYLATGIVPDPLEQGNHLPSTGSALPRLQEAFVMFPNVSLPLIELHLCSPRASLSEGSRQSQDITANFPDQLVQPESQRECASSERVRTSTSVATDIPLAVVRDIISALLRKETTVEAVEFRICAAHKLSPLVTESIMQIVRENLSPARIQQRYVVS